MTKSPTKNLTTRSSRSEVTPESISMHVDNAADAGLGEVPRVLSEAQCHDLLARAQQMARAGATQIGLESAWRGELRFGRNMFTSTGDVRDNTLYLTRTVRGAAVQVEVNMVDDLPLEAAVRRAERLMVYQSEDLFGEELAALHYKPLPAPKPAGDQKVDEAVRSNAMAALIRTPEPMASPKLFFEKTYDMDAERRADAIAPLVGAIVKAGMWAAGFMQVRGNSRAVMSSQGQSLYYGSTAAQYSVTVRDRKGNGSGWAGVDWNEWARIDGEKLTAIALDKCIRSQNPVLLEPGRYTTILEPQAVADLCWRTFSPALPNEGHAGLDFFAALAGGGLYTGGFVQGPNGQPVPRPPKIGQRFFDERVTVTMDPAHPDASFVPFDLGGNVYHATTWVEHGVLRNLAYVRTAATQYFGRERGQPTTGSFVMSGGNTAIDEMIATTKRGVYVTRFWDVTLVDPKSLLSVGYTRDGVWLIENGKISKAIKNFRFTESPAFVLNSIDLLGVPQRVFHPAYPIVVPPLKVRDFSFTSLSSAV